MADIQEIKAKFTTLQNTVTKLNNEKIGLESEIKTITVDLEDISKKLLDATGTTSVEDAFKYYKDQNTILEDKKSKIAQELDEYLTMDQDEAETT